MKLRRTLHDTPSELRALDAYRLDRDLTYKALSDEMSAADCPIELRALHKLLRTDGLVPHDRTLNKVRKFLRHVAAKRSARRAAASSNGGRA